MKEHRFIEYIHETFLGIYHERNNLQNQSYEKHKINIHDIHKILISSIIFANCLLTLMYPKKFSHEKTKRKPTFPTRREREKVTTRG